MIEMLRRVVAGVAIVFALAGCGRTLERIQKTLVYKTDHPRASLRGYAVDSYGMVPTIKPGDAVLVDRRSYATQGPQRGDLVVFVPPTSDIVSQRLAAQRPFLKRIVAIGGDRLSVTGGWLSLNGRLKREQYIVGAMNYDLRIQHYRIECRYPEMHNWTLLKSQPAAHPPRWVWQAPDRVPSGYFVVLGDNRNDSEDSHVFGFVRRSLILGKVVEIF